MGLINFFKKMFGKKVISLPPRRRDVLIQPYSSGYTKIELGQKIMVDHGWSAVIVAKEEVLDVFSEGTHEMSLAYLPKTCKALKLDKGKIVKTGVVSQNIFPKSFKCDLYFVRTEFIANRSWESEPIKVREKNKKNFKYTMQGQYSFQVQAPDKVVGLFLIDWGFIKTGKAIQKLDYLVSEVCSEALWNKRYKDKKELVQYDFANLVLKPVVNKNFMRYGLCITDMRVNRIIYPESSTTETFPEVNPDIITENQQNNEGLVDADKNELTYEEQNSDILGKLNNVNYTNNQKSELDNSLNSAISNGGQIPFYDFNDEHKNNNYKTGDELVKTDNMCKYCGAELPEGSLFCNKCGNKVN